MVIPTLAPSILIFELNRKVLLYKILDKSLGKELRKEIIELFGVNYVKEKNAENSHKKTHFDNYDISAHSNYKEELEAKAENESMKNSKASTDSGQFLDSSIEEANEDDESTEDNTETDNTHRPTRTSSPNTAKTEKKNDPVAKLTLTNDLIYEFFSPMVNSFEITREINFVFEHVLINKNKYTIRFYLYANCLILLIYNFGDEQRNSLSTSSRSRAAGSELTRHVYIDFYTNWFNKSLVSLLKFKFGICSDERCFKLSANKNEIKRLYLKWSEYFLNEPAYFVEAIEQLVVNEDIKTKCRFFLDELVSFLFNMDSILSQFDYLDDSFDRRRKSDDDEDEGGDMEFLNHDNDDDNLMNSLNSKSFEIEEFERFFSDPTQINQFMLTYNSKLLYKYRKSNKESSSSRNNNNSNFAIDSSSVFMLLLEAAEFLNYSAVPLVDADTSSLNLGDRTAAAGSPSSKAKAGTDESSDSDNDRFESASDMSDSAKSESEEESSDLEDGTDMVGRREGEEPPRVITIEDNLNMNMSYMESFKTPMSTQMSFLNEKFEKEINGNRMSSLSKNGRVSSFTSQANLTRSGSVPSNIIAAATAAQQRKTPQELNIEETLSLKNLKSANNFKKANCFLLNSNKLTLGYHEVLFLKLSDSLCLVMIKQHKYSKYCELISDFENLLVDFSELLNRKRLKLSDLDTSASVNNNRGSISEEAGKTLHRRTSNSSKRGSSADLGSLIGGMGSSTPLISQEDKMDKNFLSFFINKIVIFNDKLTNLKNELNNNQKSQSSGGFKLKDTKSLLSKTMNNFKQYNYSDNNASAAHHSSLGRISRDEMQTKNIIKLIHSIQVKLNQFINNAQFKELIGFINSGGALAEGQNLSPVLLCLRQTETQINQIQTSLKELFYELFLTNATTVSKNLTELSARRKRRISSLLAKRKTGRRHGSGSLSDAALFKSIHFLDTIKALFNKNLYHYLDYLDIKFKRNVSMAFYSHKLTGLVHFSLVNRQTNVGIVPTIDAEPQYNLSEFRINLAYRKYIPIVLTMLYKNDCTQFKFVDDKLEIVFCYSVWFEDVNFNKVPIEFNEINNIGGGEVGASNGVGGGNGSTRPGAGPITNLGNKQMFEVNNFLYKKAKLANIYKDHGKNCPFGITSVSYYDILKSICYPNAPDESLTCYELVAIFSSRTPSSLVDTNLRKLYDKITKNVNEMS